jgi:hypothetical protein
MSEKEGTNAHVSRRNLKGYWEFAAANRADGWNTWLTFAISPAPPEAAPRTARMQ